MAKMNLMTALTLNASGFSEGISAAKGELSGFQQTIGQASKETIKAFKDISQMGIGEMKRNLLELRNISFSGKSQEEIDAINARIGEVADTMADLRAQQNALGMDFGSAMAKGIQVFSAAGETIFGVATMFGVSKEKAAEYQQAMTSLIGVTQGLGVLQEAYETRIFVSIGTQIKNTAATVADTAAKWANAAASRAMGTAIAINPMLLAATAAAALVGGIIALTRAFQDNRSALDETNESLQTTIQLQQQAQQATLDLTAKNADLTNQIERDAGKISEQTYNQRKAALEKESALRALDKSEKQALADFDKGLKAEEARTYAMTVDDYARWEKKKTEIVSDFSQQRAQIIKEEFLKGQLGAKTNTPKNTKAKKDPFSGMEIGGETALAEYGDFLKQQAALSKKTNDEEKKMALDVAQTEEELLKAGDEAYSKSMANRLEMFTKAELAKIDLGKAYTEQINDLNAAVTAGMSNFANAFSEGVADLLTGDGGINSFFSGLLGSLGAFLKQMGSAVVAYGITMEAFKKAFVNPLAAVAAGVALIVTGAMVANYAGKLDAGKFASGGVVPGNSFTGDKMIAHVNSGEAIFTKQQFDAITSGQYAGGGMLTARVSGEDLLFVLDRTARKQNNTR